MLVSKKFVIIIFLPVFLLSLVFCKPVEVQAQKAVESFHKEIPLQIPIPGFTQPCQTEPYKSQGKSCVNDIGEYISQFYKYFAGAAAILATVMMLFSGFQWVTASGNASRIEKAKTTMNGALIGLVLTLTAYVLLRTINPGLVSFNSLYLSSIKSEYLSAVFCHQFSLDKLKIYDEYQKKGETLYEMALDCGKEYELKSGGSCLGSACPQGMQEVGEGPLVCGPNFDTNTFSCQNAQKLCENTAPSHCSEIDDVFNKTGLEFVCRKLNRTAVSGVIGVPDICKFASLIPHPESLCQDIGQQKISCKYTGSNPHDDDTPCWDGEKPGNLDVTNNLGFTINRLACNSTNRIGVGVDSFCCANIAKNKVECRFADTNFDNIDKTLMEVSCTQTLTGLGLTEPLNSMPGQYYTGETTCNEGCYIHVDLKYVKE